MFSKENRTHTLSGILFVALFACAATFIAEFPLFRDNHISPLIIGIILGIFYSHTLRHNLPKQWEAGIIFSTKKILRFAIVFYGFRLTFQDIAHVGLDGIIISICVVTFTFLLGMFIGKFLKLDKEITILTSAGSSICGAAAVLATEGVVNAKAHKSAIAVGTVVVFGTIGMFLFPFLYKVGFYNFTDEQIGLYLGGTLHEVANVVAAGNSLGDEIAKYAVIEKMIRVMMLAPFLIILSYYLAKTVKNKNENIKSKITIPWFAILFIAVAIFNSFDFLPHELVNNINTIDTFLLTMAMTALGMETHINKFKSVGMKPIYLALVLFIWLMFGGIALVSAVTQI